MERSQTFQFSDDELDTLESALALYAAYTREMEVDMLVGDESDADEVCANHNRAKSMHQKFFELTHETTFDEERAAFARIHGRPMDINDFSPFDWFRHVRDSHGDGNADADNEYRVNYFEEGDRIEKTIEGDRLETLGGGFDLTGAVHVIKRDGETVWSHDVTSTNTVEKIE